MWTAKKTPTCSRCSLHTVQCGRLTFRKGSEHGDVDDELPALMKRFFRFTRISVHMASLIHSLTWPLSLPLLSGEILRGFTLEFLPCAFYPLAYTHSHTHIHKRTHTPPHSSALSKDFISLYICVFTVCGNTERDGQMWERKKRQFAQISWPVCQEGP